MKILIIGGTRFQGRYLVQKLLAAGHSVTIFHRGNHSVGSQIGLTSIIGNRDLPESFTALAGMDFDACIDTCAYFPAQIALVAKTLKIRHYCLISTVYVYADRDALLPEDSPLSLLPNDIRTTVTPQNYGALKAECEREVLEHFGDSSLLLRPSIIIGIGDHTERLLFWLRLASKHGKRLDVSHPDPIFQLVDVRDLVQFTVKCIETSQQGAVNVCGEPLSLTRLLDLIASLNSKRLERKRVTAGDVCEINISRLPYCDSGRVARYDSTLAKQWGFVSRDLRDSLSEIHANYQHQEFAMQRFQVEEAAVLQLFV